MAQRRRTRQVRRILNCVPSQNTKNDWRVYNATDSGLLAAPAAIPDKTDLRAAWWKIGDQRSTGSCVGWASADSVLRWHFVKVGRLNQNDRLSVRFQWMASKETDEFITRPTTFIEAEGTSLKAALAVARRFGAVREEVLPFGSATLYQEDEATFYALAGQLRITAYFNLGDDLRDWRAWLAANGPILTRLDVDRTWDEATDTEGKLDVYQPETARGGHAVALVGYTPDRFIVRNSWDTDWGDKGFAYASLEYASSAFTEAYGVTIA
jgi:hypothetical protein